MSWCRVGVRGATSDWLTGKAPREEGERLDEFVQKTSLERANTGAPEYTFLSRISRSELQKRGRNFKNQNFSKKILTEENARVQSEF